MLILIIPPICSVFIEIHRAEDTVSRAENVFGLEELFMPPQNVQERRIPEIYVNCFATSL
jgi:hypothetical protein